MMTSTRMTLTRILSVALFSIALTACDIPNADISGTVTYDHVPHFSDTNALNYAATEALPVRGLVIEAIEKGKVIASSPIDDNGHYQLTVKMDKFIILRVKSTLTSDAAHAHSWSVSVVDNTQSDALYALETSEFEVKREVMTKNVHASSGWFSNAYNAPRTAAPFHILDRVYDSLLKLQAVDSAISLPNLTINWSPNNIPQFGDITTGQIGTSYYSDHAIYLLGAEGQDTDEYDGHVIIHEWAHFFEDTLARSDSIGGGHAGGDRLDMRVAFGEGFGNAWAGIITDDPVYRDSYGAEQSAGFSIDVENNNNSNPGWYSEGSVQSIIYDIYDEAPDGQDTLNLGLRPLYQVLTNQQQSSPAFTSIFTFASYLIDDFPEYLSQIGDLLVEQNINPSVNIWATKETDDAREPNALPIYVELNLLDRNTLCTSTAFGSSGNKLANHRYLKLNTGVAGNYRLLITPSSPVDADALVFQNGSLLADEQSVTSGAITLDFVTQETSNNPTSVAVADVSAYDASGLSLVATCFDVELLPR